MARKLKPLPPSVITADRAAIRALQSLPDYQPFSEAYSLTTLQMLDATLLQAEQAEGQIEESLDHARETKIATSYSVHNAVRALKSHVVVQYGADSSVIELFGLKRRSNYKQPAHRKTKES